MPVPNSIAAMADEVTAWRRDIHSHPELAYEEVRTSSLVAGKLAEFGFDEVHRGVGRTGVVGVLHGADGPAKGEQVSVMLRADMDALPIREESGAPHASTVEGVMHACGHDGHTAMLLGAAKHLAAGREFSGTVYFCFQPAEEGGAGAAAMIEDGLFERFPCRAVFGMHNWPGIPAGSFGIRPGPMFASADEFRIEVVGSGCHAAQPHHGKDPVAAAAAIVTALQTVVSRNVDPLTPAVVSLTQIHGGDTFNVIPDRVEMGGTVRAFDESVRSLIFARIGEIVREVAAAHGVAAESTQPRRGYPPTVNDAEETTFAADVAEAVAGGVNRSFPATMGGEDFAFMAQRKPGAFIFVGAGESHPRLHTAAYDYNDEILPVGIAYWTQLVQSALPKTS